MCVCVRDILIFFSFDPVNIIGFRTRKITISSPRLRAKLVRVVRRRSRKIARCHFDRRKEKKEGERKREQSVCIKQNQRYTVITTANDQQYPLNSIRSRDGITRQSTFSSCVSRLFVAKAALSLSLSLFRLLFQSYRKRRRRIVAVSIDRFTILQ